MITASGTPIEITSLADSCTECGICRKACPFLEKYGSPKNIITEHPYDAFLCTNCGACNALCPADISPAEVFLSTKHGLINAGTVSGHIKKVLHSALSFSSTGHKFPFSFHPSSGTVFWPGCSLSAYPALAKKALALVRKHVDPETRIMLDCCFDPVYQLGDLDTTQSALNEIQEHLDKKQAKKLITGCTNCQKILSQYLKGITVEHIFTVIPDTVRLRSTNNPLLLHHPCPAFKTPGMKEGVRSLFPRQSALAGEMQTPSCCGYGGSLRGVDQGLSKQFAEKILDTAGENTIVTYCMGCKKSFMEKGGRAYHVLELLTGNASPRKPVSGALGWLNRFLLASEQRLWNKKFFFSLFIVFLIGLVFYLRRSGYFSLEDILAFLRGHPVLAPILFILIYTVTPSLFLPAIPLSLSAGFLWGPFWGVVFSITGATLGASVSFIVSRYIMGEAVKTGFGRTKWETIEGIVEKHGWKAVAFSRLIPILPFNMLNYIFGITPIPFKHYLWCTFVFMLPGCIAFVAFGNSMGDIMRGNIKGLIVGIIVASAALLLPLAFKPLIRKIFGDRS